MNLLKKNVADLSFILPLLILVLIRLSGAGKFKPDLKKWTEPTFSQTNVITPEQATKMPGNKLIISFAEGVQNIPSLNGEFYNIKPDSLLSGANLDRIKNHKGPVFLFSLSDDITSRIWMLLSQTGCRNLYILAGNTDNEVFKYNFNPDNFIMPEL